MLQKSFAGKTNSMRVISLPSILSSSLEEASFIVFEIWERVVSLFLKTVKILPLYDEKIKRDLSSLDYEEFISKYNLPSNVDLWKDLKKGIKSGEYPAFLKK